jgi:hypothetical protein
MDVTAIQPYQYTQLGPDEFRVVEVHLLDPDISIQLRTFVDKNMPDYCALSYAWGDTSATSSIICDGQSIMISPRLQEGIRNVFTATACRLLWVDAICINQSDDTEKAVQVAKMHHIYQKATSVYVWLGPASDTSDLAISAMNELRVIPERTADLQESIVKLKTSSPTLFDESVFKPLAQLSRRSWFERLWIVPEYFHGNSVLFICGTKVLDATHFNNIIEKMSIYSFGGHEPQGYQDEPDLFTGFHKLLEIQQINQSRLDNKRLSFFDLVMLGRGRQAREPVDRIYSAFGMAEGLDSIYRTSIPIDYSPEARREYWRVYSQFGKAALMHEPHLRLLSVTGSVERATELPSWCPNLNSTTPTSKFDEVYAAGWPHKDHNQELGADCSKHSHFRTKDESHVSFSLSTDSIKIWGAALDRVSLLGQPCEWDPDVDTENLLTGQTLAKELLEWLDSSDDFCGAVLSDKVLGNWVWNEILVGGNGRGPRSPDSDSGKTSVYQFLQNVLQQVVQLTPDNSAPDQNPTLYEGFETIYLWIMVTHELFNGRRLFATETGKLGFGSLDIREGDLVSMLYGGKTMYVLRPHGAGDKEVLVL